MRKLKVPKERAACALWFAKSFGLELVSLKLTQNYSFNYKPEISNMDAEEQAEGNSTVLSDIDNSEIEQVLFLLDKFYIREELNHEFTIGYDDMPRSYLIKQRRSDLNKLCHVENLPGSHPGAQWLLKELLGQHVRD